MTLIISEDHFNLFKGEDGRYYVTDKKGQRLVPAKKKKA
jgi:hypothetical protein